jgi:hypothetical protein
MDYSPEVLIYLQTVKNYFLNNKEAKSYFLSNLNEDEFFQHIMDVAENNFKKKGEPQLNREQFEFLRVSLMIFKQVEEEEEMNTIYEYTSKNLIFYLK